MSDLISRQTAIEIIQSMYPGMPRVHWMREDWQKRYEPYIRIENAIRELPSAQSKQKKGKCHRRFYPHVEMMVCSECQEEFSYDAETGVRNYNYCPNCGADMRGEEDG